MSNICTRLHQRQWSDNIQPHNKTESKTTIRERKTGSALRRGGETEFGEHWERTDSHRWHRNWVFHAFTEARMTNGERLAFSNPCPGIKRHTADKGRATAISVITLPPAGDSAEYTLTRLQGIINSGWVRVIRLRLLHNCSTVVCGSFIRLEREEACRSCSECISRSLNTA